MGPTRWSRRFWPPLFMPSVRFERADAGIGYLAIAPMELRGEYSTKSNVIGGIWYD